MAKTKRRVKRKRTVKRSGNKPIGFTRVGKKFALVFGTKTKPRLGKSRFNSKKTLLANARKRLR